MKHQTSVNLQASPSITFSRGFQKNTLVSGGRKVSAGITGNGQNCQNAGCNGKLTWVDGTPFVYESWMASEFEVIVKYNAKCLGYGGDIRDQYCSHYLYFDGVCEKTCLVP